MNDEFPSLVKHKPSIILAGILAATCWYGAIHNYFHPEAYSIVRLALNLFTLGALTVWFFIVRRNLKMVQRFNMQRDIGKFLSDFIETHPGIEMDTGGWISFTPEKKKPNDTAIH